LKVLGRGNFGDCIFKSFWVTIFTGIPALPTPGWLVHSFAGHYSTVKKSVLNQHRQPLQLTFGVFIFKLFQNKKAKCQLLLLSLPVQTGL